MVRQLSRLGLYIFSPSERDPLVMSISAPSNNLRVECGIIGKLIDSDRFDRRSPYETIVSIMFNERRHLVGEYG